MCNGVEVPLFGGLQCSPMETIDDDCTETRFILMSIQSAGVKFYTVYRCEVVTIIFLSCFIQCTGVRL